MKLGLLVRADDSGLGYQTRDYYKHLNPHKTMLVDISIHNGMAQHYDWYEGAYISKGFPRREMIIDFLRDLDVVLTAETPYSFEIYAMAKLMGVKTVCVENPEFYDHIKYPEFPMPDMMILPSVWKQDEIKAHAEPRGVKVVQIHHPVDRTTIPFRKRTTKRFIHIAGKPAAFDRNGTWDYLAACPDGIVITQSDDLAYNIRKRYRQSRVLTNIKDNSQIYDYGDVLVLPRKYGGNCLPLNEALASGMPVIMPDIEPNDNILPKEWLVPARKVSTFAPRTEVDIYDIDADALVEKINWFKNCNIEEESLKANKIAETISWQTLKPKYIEALEALE